MNNKMCEYVTCKNCNNNQKLLTFGKVIYTIRCDTCGKILKKGIYDTVDHYAEYLKSEHWLTTRRLALEHYKNKCAVCGTNKKLNVHHLTYENIGMENLADLQILCKKHHEEEHESNSE